MSALMTPQELPQFPRSAMLQASPDIEGAYYTLALLTPSWVCWMYWAWQDLPSFLMLGINSAALAYFALFTFVCRKTAQMKIQLDENHLVLFTSADNRFIPFDKITKLKISNNFVCSFFKIEIDGERPEYITVFFKGSAQVLNSILKYNSSLASSQRALNYTHWSIISENFSRRLLEDTGHGRRLLFKYGFFPLALLGVLGAFQWVLGGSSEEFLKSLPPITLALFLTNALIGFYCWNMKEMILMLQTKWVLSRHPQVAGNTPPWLTRIQVGFHFLAMMLVTAAFAYFQFSSRFPIPL